MEVLDQRALKGNITREKILYSVLNIITTEGIKSVSASKIAKLSGISKSTVFHHFTKIEEIPFQALKEISFKINTSLEKRTFSSFKDYLSYLEEITFKNNNDENVLYRALFAFYQEAMYSPRYKDAITECSSKFIEITKKQLLKHTNFETDKIDNLAKLIMTTIDGLGIHYLISSDDKLINSWNEFSKMILSSTE